MNMETPKESNISDDDGKNKTETDHRDLTIELLINKMENNHTVSDWLSFESDRSLIHMSTEPPIKEYDGTFLHDIGLFLIASLTYTQKFCHEATHGCKVKQMTHSVIRSGYDYFLNLLTESKEKVLDEHAKTASQAQHDSAGGNHNVVSFSAVGAIKALSMIPHPLHHTAHALHEIEDPSNGSVTISGSSSAKRTGKCLQNGQGLLWQRIVCCHPFCHKSTQESQSPKTINQSCNDSSTHLALMQLQNPVLSTWHSLLLLNTRNVNTESEGCHNSELKEFDNMTKDFMNCTCHDSTLEEYLSSLPCFSENECGREFMCIHHILELDALMKQRQHITCSQPVRVKAWTSDTSSSSNTLQIKTTLCQISQLLPSLILHGLHKSNIITENESDSVDDCPNMKPTIVWDALTLLMSTLIKLCHCEDILCFNAAQHVLSKVTAILGLLTSPTFHSTSRSLDEHKKASSSSSSIASLSPAATDNRVCNNERYSNTIVYLLQQQLNRKENVPIFSPINYSIITNGLKIIFLLQKYNFQGNYETDITVNATVLFGGDSFSLLQQLQLHLVAGELLLHLFVHCHSQVISSDWLSGTDGSLPYWLHITSNYLVRSKSGVEKTDENVLCENKLHVVWSVLDHLSSEREGNDVRWVNISINVQNVLQKMSSFLQCTVLNYPFPSACNSDLTSDSEYQDVSHIYVDTIFSLLAFSECILDIMERLNNDSLNHQNRDWLLRGQCLCGDIFVSLTNDTRLIDCLHILSASMNNANYNACTWMEYAELLMSSTHVWSEEIMWKILMLRSSCLCLAFLTYNECVEANAASCVETGRMNSIKWINVMIAPNAMSWIDWMKEIRMLPTISSQPLFAYRHSSTQMEGKFECNRSTSDLPVLNRNEMKAIIESVHFVGKSKFECFGVGLIQLALLIAEFNLLEVGLQFISSTELKRPSPASLPFLLHSTIRNMLLLKEAENCSNMCNIELFTALFEKSIVFSKHSTRTSLGNLAPPRIVAGVTESDRLKLLTLKTYSSCADLYHALLGRLAQLCVKYQ